jgi:hypothetical protein
MRRAAAPLLAGLAFLLTPAVPRAAAEPYTPRAGDVRAVFHQRETVLRGDPKPLAAVSAKLAYGTVVRVDRVEGAWIQVTAVQGGTGSGWLPANHTIEPRLLTAPRPAAGGTGAAGVTSTQISAAGRQLVEGAEKGYRGANPNLEAYYPHVDRIEKSNRDMTPEEIAAFARRGRLGR